MQRNLPDRIFSLLMEKKRKKVLHKKEQNKQQYDL